MRNKKVCLLHLTMIKHPAVIGMQCPVRIVLNCAMHTRSGNMALKTLRSSLWSNHCPDIVDRGSKRWDEKNEKGCLFFRPQSRLRQVRPF
jgi:hypothetical protein